MLLIRPLVWNFLPIPILCRNLKTMFPKMVTVFYSREMFIFCQQVLERERERESDFNAGTTNTFGGLLEDFCMENGFIISDYALLPQDTFTYISDAHNFLDRPFCLILFSASSNVQYGCANRVHNLWSSGCGSQHTVLPPSWIWWWGDGAPAKSNWLA